jgi:hypothetical protein
VLEFRKTPMPESRRRQRRASLTSTQVAQAQALVAMHTETLIDQLDATSIAPPSLRRSDRLGVGGPAAAIGSEAVIGLPELGEVSVTGVKESVRQVDMSLDLLSIRDMDTGQYQAMVIQDPDDRRSISGYMHLAQGFTRNRASIPGNIGRDRTIYQSLDFLIKALHEYTGIEADYTGPIPLDDPDLLKVPWLLLPSWFGEAHSSSEAELANLGRYLAAGGFALTTSRENEKLRGGKFDRLRQALNSQHLYEGADWRFVYLKPDHPIYHSFFDFDMAVRDNMEQGNFTDIGDMGLVVGERLAVLMTAKSITTQSGREGTVNFEDPVDATRHLQFSVNTVVFALTQEGGVTQQLMSGIK